MRQLSIDQIKQAYEALPDEDKHAAMSLVKQGKAPQEALRLVQSGKDQQAAYDQGSAPSTGMKVAAGAEGLANGLSFGAVPITSAILEKLGVDKSKLIGPEIDAAKETAPSAYGGGEVLGTVAQLLLGGGAAAGAKSLPEIPSALLNTAKGGAGAITGLAKRAVGSKLADAIDAAGEAHNSVGAVLKGGKALLSAAPEAAPAAETAEEAARRALIEEAIKQIQNGAGTTVAR